MNIKGVFQIWMKDGAYHEIDLKECHAWTREGCKTAPTSPPSTPTSPPAASARTTTGRSTIVRTELGEEIISRMIADGVDHRPPGPGGREGDEAAAPALDRQPPPLAGVRRAGADRRRASAQEEGRRLRSCCALTRRGRRTARDVLTVAAGLVTGILSGAFGVGGAVISTPFIRGLGASATIAIGTTLPSVIPSSISGSLRYGREGLIAWEAVKWIVPIGVVVRGGWCTRDRDHPR